MIQMRPYLGLIALAAALADARANDAGPVRAEMDAYLEASAQLAPDADPRERRDFYAAWLDRLLRAIEQQPDSPDADAALAIAVSLANGRSDYALAAELAERLRAGAAAAWDRACWARSAGRAWLAIGRADAARQGLTRLQESLAVFRDLSQPTWQQQPRQALLELVGATQDIAAALHQTAHDERIPEEWRASRRVLEQVPAATQRKGPRPGMLEYLASRESLAWGAQGRPLEALEAIRRVVDVPDLFLPPSVYVDQAAVAFARQGGAYVEMVEQWLERAEPDAWTPVLELRLAMVLVRGEAAARGLALLEQLHAEHWETMGAFDDKAVADGLQPDRVGGHQAELLAALAEGYLRIGDRAAAKAYAQELEEAFPQHLRTRNVRDLLAQADQSDLSRRGSMPR